LSRFNAFWDRAANEYEQQQDPMAENRACQINYKLPMRNNFRYN